MSYEIHRVENHLADTIAKTRSQLALWNASLSSIAEEKEIAREALDGDGQMIGGLGASIWGSVMELEFLWVGEHMRGIGIGSGLLRHAEGIAKECGCTTVTTNTYSFQAPGFYRKFGYTSVATLDGFPDGIRKYVLLKELSSEPVGAQGAGHQV